MNKIITNKTTFVLLICLLLISGISHGFNLLHYPYFEDDEGTYIAQAWSVSNIHQLSPYTYMYDHAPIGWIFISFWEFITRGIFNYGFSLNSGRIFMLVLHLVDAVILFGIAKKLLKSNIAGIISVLLFSLSPMAIFFQRRVLLDNLMTFWFLVSLFFVLGIKRKLSHFFLSAICFGLSVLSKETAIFFLPAFIYIIYTQANSVNRRFALVMWLFVSLSIISGYILYATLKGELFPSGTLLGGSSPHVSLIQTFIWQSSRKGGFFLSRSSEFWIALSSWLQKDSPFIIYGMVATIGNILYAIHRREFRILSALTICMWFFLIRGGVITDFYIIPLIPLLALNIGGMVTLILNFVKKKSGGKFIQFLPISVLAMAFALYYINQTEIYTIDQTTAQIQAVSWVKNNLPSNSVMIMDNYAFVDLNKNVSNIYTPAGAQYYWKIDTDPEVESKVINYDWKNIKYLLVTPQMKHDLFSSALNQAKLAYLNSQTLKTFQGNGWDVDIRKVNPN